MFEARKYHKIITGILNLKANCKSVESPIEALFTFFAPMSRESSAEVPTCSTVSMAKTSIKDCKPRPTAATAKAEIVPTIIRSVTTCNISKSEFIAAGTESFSIF